MNKYWYYLKQSTGSGQVSYSNVLTCHTQVTTPGYFTKQDAVGPFDDFNTAFQAVLAEVKALRDEGRRTFRVSVVCDTRWEDKDTASDCKVEVVETSGDIY